MHKMTTPNKLKIAFFIPASLAENRNAEKYLQEEYDPYYRFILIVSEFMKFKFEVLSFNTVGKKQANGSWTGAIGMIKNLEADMTANQLLVNEERSEVLHYAYPFRFYPTTFIIEKHENTSEFLGILKIFTLSTWFVFVLLVIAMIFIMFILMKQKYSLGDILLYVLATSLGQNVIVKSWTIRQNIVICSWMVGIMFLYYCYTSVLLSFLTIPTFQKIRTMQELADAIEKDGYKCFYDSYLIAGPTMLVNSNMKPLVTVGEHLMNNPNRFRKFDDFLETKKEKTAFFKFVESVPLLPDNYFVSEDYVLDVLCAMATRKDFCCKEQLDDVVHRIMASGLYAKIKEDKMFLAGLKFRAEVSSVQNERSLTLSDFYLAFIVLVFGYLLSSAILAAELIFR